MQIKLNIPKIYLDQNIILVYFLKIKHKFSYNVIAYYYFPLRYAFIGGGFFNGTLNIDQDAQPNTKKISFTEEVIYVGFITPVPIIPEDYGWRILGTMSLRPPGKESSFIENNLMIGVAYEWANPDYGP